MRLVGKFILIGITLLPTILFGQNRQNEINNFKISISQQILPGSNPDYIYKLSDKKIRIYKSKTLLRYKLFSQRLDKIQTDSLLLLVKNAYVFNLDSNYDSGSLDGINWTFEIKIINQYKEIRLDNYYLKQLGDIVDFINRQIPQKKICISFDFFNIRNDFN